MYRLFELLNDGQVARLHALAAGASWDNGRVTNPTNTGKNNEQLAEGAAREECGATIASALTGSPIFNDFAMPVAVAFPLISRYAVGMGYALHGDNAYLSLGNITIRNDLACTVFLSDPASYDGGALMIHSGDVKAAFRLPAGHAIVYPANTPHLVEPVTRGERLAAFTFIQSRIADPVKRTMAWELGTLARELRPTIDPSVHARLLVVQQNLLREWGDAP